jgi:hypothetical protein
MDVGDGIQRETTLVNMDMYMDFSPSPNLVQSLAQQNAAKPKESNTVTQKEANLIRLYRVSLCIETV